MTRARQRSTTVFARMAVAAAVAACSRGPAPQSDPTLATLTPNRLPTGVRLAPAGRAYDVGSFPLAAVLSPDRSRVVLLLNGWREQGVQVVDRRTGDTVQTLPQAAAFLGLAFSPDGHTLYASGGNQDVVYRYAWRDDRAMLTDSIVLDPAHSRTASGQEAAPTGSMGSLGHRYPAGVAPSPDGRWLYVAENLGDSLAVVDLANARVTERLATQRYPYAVAVDPAGVVYVSAWGGHTVSVFAPTHGGVLTEAGRITVSRHPSALLLHGAAHRLYVASASTDTIDVIDTDTRRVVAHLTDPPPAGLREGSTPNALALSMDGTRLFVAEADNNAVAVFRHDSLVGRIPVGWYPTAVVADAGDTLLVVNGKGRGAGPNSGTGPWDGRRRAPEGYTLGQLSGTLNIIAPPDGALLTSFTDRVAHANGWDVSPQSRPVYPPIEHVVYIIKENRTYDQVFGDLPQADGDTALVFFPRAVSPNHHALAERFGIYDRFFVNAEVSADGHSWSTAAYATDYTEKTVPSNYSWRRHPFDYEGTNRDSLPPDGDDVAAPSAGYLWDLAARKGITLRNYGEFIVEQERSAEDASTAGRAEGAKPALVSTTCPDFAGFNLRVSDQKRADVWIGELQQFVQRGSMPALEIVRLPNDHTAGAKAGAPTPRAYMADNDLALGRIIEALSHTPFWAHTAVFVLEDDAQNGADHVDSHRSPLLVISPYARGGVIHRFANTTDVLATIEEILGLDALSPFDRYGRPLRDAFGSTPDLRPYAALTPQVPLTEVNLARNPEAKASRRLRLDAPDESDDALFNRILWRAVKGPNVPEPPPRRATTLDFQVR